MATINQKHQIFKLLATTSIAFLLFFWLGAIKQSGSFQVSFEGAALARDFRPEQVADDVYQRLSFLPQENGYLNRNTRDIDKNNTLVKRFIRYHLYVKSRSVVSRFDWKLTLADYLGYNETLLESRYPGYKTLQKNPIEGDRQAINNLSKEQRDRLVDTLFSIYNPEGAKLLEMEQNIQTTRESTDKPNSQPRLYQSKPGDADLLKF